jgi:hypothetical protein
MTLAAPAPPREAAPLAPADPTAAAIARFMPRLWQLPPLLAHMLVHEVLTGHTPGAEGARLQRSLQAPPLDLPCFGHSHGPHHLCLLRDAQVRALAAGLLDGLLDLGLAVVAITPAGDPYYLLLPDTEGWLQRYATGKHLALPSHLQHLHRAYHYLLDATGFDAVRQGAPWQKGASIHPEAARLRKYGLTANQAEAAFLLLQAQGGGNWSPGAATFRPAGYGAFARAADTAFFRPFVRACCSHTLPSPDIP